MSEASPVKKAEFLLSCPDVQRMPPAQLPEFAFAGRSNVGKSSLINYLCNQRGLAKTSSTPGKTQLINLFCVDDQWCLVDLPGYGYAKVSQAKREHFRKMVIDYAIRREALYTLFVLIDANIPPQMSDLLFLWDVGTKGVPVALIFTKIDRAEKATISRNIQLFCNTLLEQWEELPPKFLTSASNRTGGPELIAYIHSCIRDVPFRP
jgi:GTP-binding protein